MAQDSHGPERFRIGPKRNKVIYNLVAPGVWMCERAYHDSDSEEQRLWLRKLDPAPGADQPAMFVAYEAPNSDEVQPLGSAIFSSTDPDVLTNGFHDWILCLSANQSIESFETAVLPPGST